MRLHSDILNRSDIVTALHREQAAGRIAPQVGFKILSQHGSRSHARAFEVQIDAEYAVKGDGRRVGNSGSYGALDSSNGYAATYDEWGWLMSALYAKDPQAVWGSVNHPQYASREDFDDKTGMTYHPEILLRDLTGDGGYRPGDPYPYVYPRGGRVGRRGAGRRAEQMTAWGQDYLTHAPRTAQAYREFAKV